MRKIHSMISLGQCAVAGLWLFAAGDVLLAQSAGNAPGDDPGAARLKIMTRHARALKLTESEKPVLLMADPIFRYDDKARGIQDSTIWAWGRSGRPSAVLKLEVNPARPTDRHWLYSVVSLSPNPIKVEGDEGWQWSATEPGLVLNDIPRSPTPAGAEPARLRQMKDLSHRFEAREYSGPHGRLQLRLLARPIHRYADASKGLVDGAIFGFAYGTNPDLLLLVERGGRAKLSRNGNTALPAWGLAGSFSRSTAKRCGASPGRVSRPGKRPI